MLITMLCMAVYVSPSISGEEAYALGEDWEDCDSDGFDDGTGSAVPWYGFDSTKGDTVPDGWDGLTRDYIYYYPPGTDTDTGTDTGEGGTNPGETPGGDEDTASLASIAEAGVTAIPDQVYTGKNVKPGVKVTLAGKTLAAHTDYVVSYVNNIKIGTATAIITGKGEYKDTVKKAFRIIPKAISVKSLKAGKNKFTLKWKKSSGITKYQIRYRLSSAKAWNTVSVAAKTTSKVVSKLKTGKKYQVQIRSYKTVGGVKYPSAWSSKTKTVKIK
jgi:hypothetical protein